MKLKKVLLCTLFGFSFLGLAVAGLSDLSKTALMTQADSIKETEYIYNFTQFKAAMESPACRNVVLKDFETQIEMDGDPMKQGYAVTLNHNKNLIIEGEAVFTTRSTYTDGSQCAGLLKVTGACKLTVTGSGKLEFKAHLPSTIANSVIYNTGRSEVVFDCPGAEIVGNVIAAVYSKAYIQDMEGCITRFNGGSFWGTTATQAFNDTYATADILDGNVYISGGEFKTNLINNTTASMVGLRINKNVKLCEITGGIFDKAIIPEGSQISDYFWPNREYHVYDMDNNITTNINQTFKVSLAIHRFLTSPTNVELKIAQSFELKYSLDAEPNTVDLGTYNNEGERIVSKHNIKGNPYVSFDSAVSGRVDYFLIASYDVGSGPYLEVYSDDFWISVSSVYVDFERGEGSGPMVNSIPFDTLYNKKVEMIECPYQAPAGKEFYAWSYKGNYYKPGEKVPVTGDMTFTAIYRNSKIAFTSQPEDAVVGVDQSYTLSWDGSFYGCKLKVRRETSPGNWVDESGELDSNVRSYPIPAKGGPGHETYSIFVYKYDSDLETWIVATSSRSTVVRWTSGDVDIFTVRFCYAGEEDIIEQYQSGVNIVLPECSFEAPENQVFECWHCVEDDTDYYAGNEFTIDDHYIFNAQFFDGYSLNVVVDSHSVDTIEHLCGEYTLPAFEYDANLPERTHVVCWEYDSVQYLPGEKIEVSSDSELTAVIDDNSYVISFNHGTGTGTMPDQITTLSSVYVPNTPGDYFTAPSEHYEFSHWYDLTHAIALDVSEPEVNNIDEDVELMAVWKHKMYSYTYNAGEAASIPGNTAVVVENNEAESKIQLRGSDVFKAPEGKHFKTWAVGTVEGDKYGSGAEYQILGNTTFVAVWENDISYTDSGSYTVSFSAGGGTGTMTALENQSGDYVLPANGFTAPEGKEFKCWNVFGESYDAGATIKIACDTLVIAVWKNVVPVNFTISFNAGAGTGTMQSVQVLEGSSYTLPACSFAAPAGKMFDCWQVGEEYKLANEIITVDSDLTLTAIWKDIPAQTFKASFSANGGTGTMSEVNGLNGSYALPQSTFTAPTGKEFDGWKVNGEGETLKPGTVITVTANVELVAQWKDSPAPVTPDNPVTPDEPVAPEQPSKKGLSGGAIAGIVIGSTVVVGLGGFAVFWFVIKKKTFADLLAIFKKK